MMENERKVTRVSVEFLRKRVSCLGARIKENESKSQTDYIRYSLVVDRKDLRYYNYLLDAAKEQRADCVYLMEGLSVPIPEELGEKLFSL